MVPMKALRFHLLLVLGACLGMAGARAGESTLDNTDETVTATDGYYYRWIDAQGHVQYTDFEPVGLPAERVPLAPPEADVDTPMLARPGDDWQPDPFHDQDEQILPIAHIGPCADARQQLAVLHAALPVYEDEAGEYRAAWRGDAYRGPRAYLDAETRTEAIGLARAAVRNACSDPQAFEQEVRAYQNEVRDN